MRGMKMMRRLLLAGAMGAAAAAMGPGFEPVAPAAAQDAKDTLRVSIFTKARTRGNVYDTPVTSPGSYWWEAVYDSFVRLDDKGQILPHAIVRWENVNPTTWRATFRDGLTFNNGVKNDSNNVKAIFDYFLTDQGKIGGAIRTMKLASHRIVDNQTMEFVTQEPDPLVIAKFGAFYLAEMKAFNEMGIAAFSAKPVGSGPYAAVRWDDTELVAISNDKSWRPGKAKNLRITELPEASARVSALESGQTDIVIIANTDDIARIKAAGHQAIVMGAPLVNSIAMFTVDFANKWNMGGKTPFSDKRVRQAMNYAVNKDAIVQQFLQGLTQVAAQPATPASFGYNPDLKPYPFDLVKAKQLLTEAGYPNGFSMIMETQVGNVAGGAEVLQLMAADLAKIGVKLEVRGIPQATWAGLLNSKKWEGDLTQFSSFVAPPMDASVPFTFYGCNLPNTFTCVEELNPLFAAQEKEMDRGKREVLLKELMRKTNEEAFQLYLYNGIDVFGVAKRVKGFNSWNRQPHYEAISIE